MKTTSIKDSETVQGDRQCDPQISNRQAKKGKTVSATKKHISIALAHHQSSLREISEHCGLTKSHIWTILNEVGAYPSRPTPLQALMPGDA